MKYFWLNKKNNKNLIVFFNGWAMNETPVKHLKTDGFDILFLFDYRNLDFNFLEFDFNKYEKKYLICWSMGVFAANNFINTFNNFDHKVAINGTSKIVDNNFGIPEKIYKITAKFLNEDSLDKFIKNMFKGGKLNPEITITRSIGELREELFEIQKKSFSSEIKFDKAIISNDDRIIPTKNQLNFWKNKAEIDLIESTHCPFKNYSNWQDFIC